MRSTGLEDEDGNSEVRVTGVLGHNLSSGADVG